MGIFRELEQTGHERLVFFYDRETGLKSIIGIHSTALGPTLGGCRMWNYASESDALTDVLRLSKAMTYKSAVAGLDLGGGKGIIIGDPQGANKPELLRAFGRAVESLEGCYITTEDVGIGVPDVDLIRTTTKYVVGGSQAGGAGDPSRMTALGVFKGMQALLKYAQLGESLEGLRVAVQGIGNVGYRLCKYLAEAGVKLIVCDIHPERVNRAVEEFGAQAVSPSEIHRVDCEILAPCALGAVLNARTIPEMRCKVVAGAANNQLELQSDVLALHERGIIYIPDYVINAGGLINVAAELGGYNEDAVRAKVSKIASTIDLILARSQVEELLPLQVADSLAEERIAQAKAKQTGNVKEAGRKEQPTPGIFIRPGMGMSQVNLRG
jgi:leucine dehydrogenase